MAKTVNRPKDNAPRGPAAPPKAEKPKSDGPKFAWPDPLAGLTAERKLQLRRLLSLCLVIFGGFLALACFSLLFTGGRDQSLVEFGAIPNPDIPETPANKGGTIGAYLAHRLITLGFGLPGLAIPLYLVLWGLALNLPKARLWQRIANPYVVFGVMWGSFFLGYFTVLFGLETPNLGGGVGISLTQLLSLYLGITGTGILSLFLLMAFLIFKQPTLPNVAQLLKSITDTHGRDERHIVQEAAAEQAGLTPESFGQVVHREAILPDEDEDDEGGAIEGEFIVSVRKPTKGGLHSHPEDMAARMGLLDELPLTGTDAELAAFTGLHKNGVHTATGEPEFVIEKPTGDIQAPSFQANVVAIDTDTFTKDIAAEDLETIDDAEILAEWADYDPTLELSNYQYPPVELLNQYENPNGQEVSRAELEANKNKIVRTLQNYNIEITTIKATIGPTVTLYEIVPAPGIRISKIKGLEDDIALSLSALGIRIIAPIPGRGTIGIEIPNAHPETVSLRSVLATEKFRDSKAELPIAIGKTISNEVYVADLAKMPHLLVAGSTGQGKSVGLNCIIASLLYKKHPSQIKFVLIDPKKVEMTLYQALEKHFLAKLPNYPDAIITDSRQVIHVLTSLCMEMDDRYDLLKLARVRSIKEYNDKFTSRRLSPKKGHRYLPYIVLVIDELADLMMTAGKEVETPIARLAQLARAVGIHLVVATQRPSVNVITGVIKANFPFRLSYRVISKIDSRTILDANGADQLVGRGDLLLSTGTDIIRIQNAFMDTPEVEALVNHIADQRGYPTAYYLPEVNDPDSDGDSQLDAGEIDPLFAEAARLVVRTRQGSTSMLQRKFSIGYNRAGRLMDQLERAGVVGEAHGSKPREVLIADESHLEHLLSSLA